MWWELGYSHKYLNRYVPPPGALSTRKIGFYASITEFYTSFLYVKLLELLELAAHFVYDLHHGNHDQEGRGGGGGGGGERGGGGGGGVLRIVGDDRMGAKIKTQKNPWKKN